MRHPRMMRHALLGLGLSLGAPAGFWLLRVLTAGASPERELSEHGALYAYLLLAPLVPFAAFGALLGWLMDRLANANLRLAELTLTDGLTSLRNERYFEERLRAERARLSRMPSATTALVMIDLDHFKAVNDGHGHAAGDAVLRECARRLSASVRAGDVVCRVGGEELVVLCPDATLAEAAELAERLRRVLCAEPFVTERGARLKVTASFGVACTGGGMEPDVALRLADAALYRAKDAGRNRVVCAPDVTPIVPRAEVPTLHPLATGSKL